MLFVVVVVVVLCVGIRFVGIRIPRQFVALALLPRYAYLDPWFDGLGGDEAAPFARRRHLAPHWMDSCNHNRAGRDDGGGLLMAYLGAVYEYRLY